MGVDALPPTGVVAGRATDPALPASARAAKQAAASDAPGRCTGMPSVRETLPV